MYRGPLQLHHFAIDTQCVCPSQKCVTNITHTTRLFIFLFLHLALILYATINLSSAVLLLNAFSIIYDKNNPFVLDYCAVFEQKQWDSFNILLLIISPYRGKHSCVNPIKVLIDYHLTSYFCCLTKNNNYLRRTRCIFIQINILQSCYIAIINADISKAN